MPATKLADILIPEIWIPYMIERTKALSILFSSGILDQSEKYDELAAGGGATVQMPFFQDLTGESEVLNDNGSLTVNKIGATKDIAYIHHRGKAWGANDLTKALSGDDPMAAIGDLVADWWSRDFQRFLLASLEGVFKTALSTTHVLDASIADGNASTVVNKISSDNVISAFDKLGDASSDLRAIAMHSAPYHNLLKQNVIEFEQPSEQGEEIRRYLGRRVLVDDSLPKEAGGTSGFIYTSYLFGASAFGYGEGTPDMPVETDRDSLAGESYLINRRDFIMHPKGVKYVGTPAGVSPSNTELRVGASWSRAYEVKNIPIVALLTNG